MALPKLSTTRAARSRCMCPLCAGTTIDADGVYHCRAGETVEYLIFFTGSFMGARSSWLAADAELNQIRRDAQAAPVELAAAEADLDAQADEYVAEQAVCDCPRCSLAPRSTPDGVYFCATKQTVDAYHKGKLVATASDTAPVAAANLAHVKSVLDGYRATDAQATPPPAEILPFTPDNSPLDPRPTPPAISYNAATGLFSWVGAPRSYPTFLAADTARTAWLKRRRVAAAYLAADEARAEWLKAPPRGLLLAA